MAHVGFLSSFPSLSSVRVRRLSPAKNPTLVKPSAMAAPSDDPIREWILTEGKATQITGIRSIGGGCINLANRYDTDAGSFFVKTNRSIGPSMFEGEALGLNAMHSTKSIRVPKPFKQAQSVLGRKLAEMHKAAKSDKGFGFDVDNTIGR
ncbi:hypothetical protein ACLOJK_006141 [Asimina triloba]